MATTKRRMTDRLQVGLGLISASVVVLGIGSSIALTTTSIVPLRIVVIAVFVAIVVALWGLAIQNGAAERQARERLSAEHPGALVERVRLWALPKGRVLDDLPIHFIVADAREITFETINQTVLLRVPVEDLGFVDIVTAQGDRSRDKALTLIYDGDGDSDAEDQLTVQFFTITYASTDRLRARLRTAIGWPADGTPSSGTP